MTDISGGRLPAPVPTEITGPTPAHTLDFCRTANGYGVQQDDIDYLILLRRHRMAVIAIFVLCILAGLLYSQFAPKSYRAQTVLEITGVNEDFMNIRDVNPTANAAPDGSYIETQIMLLRNEAIADRVVTALLPDVPPTLASSNDERAAMIRGMLHSAKAKEEGGSNLVRVTLSGPDPDLTARTVNELARQYIEEGENARLAAASQTGVFLKQQLDEARSNLQRSEDALQEYARASGIVLTSDTHESVATEHLREIQQGLAQAEVDRANREAQIEIAQNAPADELPQVVDDPTIRADRDKLRDLRMQLADLSTTMTPANYRVEKIQAQIGDLENEMHRHRMIIVSRLGLDSREAVRREALLRQQYNQQLSEVTDQGGKQVHYNMLRHEADVNRQIYQSMVQKAKEAGLMAALRAANARVVSPAEVPLSPYSPRLSISILLSAFLALVLSAFYILVSERRNRSVRNPGESERLVARPELAVIPRARIAANTARAHRLQITRTPSDVLHPMLEHWVKGDRAFLAEAYRSAGTSILFSRRDGIRPRVLLVTSPHPQCGKTMTTANLAVSLAEGGRRVLLIDGDLRQPALPQLFGIAPALGLSNTLDEAERADPRDLIQGTPFSGVQILPSGAANDNAAKLLHSSRLSTVLEIVRSDFDFVLIDAPPLLGLADARIISKFTDGVILICRAGRTSVDDLQEARRLLVEDGTHIIGTILNGYDLQHERPSHYRTYLKYSGHASA